jgi:drug/metabolite transporter (DMT)-like permease
MPASLLSTFLYLSPVLAMIVAWLWIGEVPVLLTVVGGLVAIGGVVIVQTLGQPPSRAAELAADPIEASDG